MGKLTGKVAVVTGASRLKGIGAAICIELAQEGCDVFFTYWKDYDKTMPWGIATNEPALLEKELIGFGVKAFGSELDLSQKDAPEKLLNKVSDLLGPPDILVNNAAYSVNGDFSVLTAEELDKHYYVNIRAAALLSTSFAVKFRKGSGGRIINMTSGHFQGPMPGEVAYAATKGAVDAMTLTLSAELAPLGITVNAVNPGPTDTGWMTEGMKEELTHRFPFGRLGEPRDAAKLVSFLAGTDAEWITGQIIHSEGGFHR